MVVVVIEAGGERFAVETENFHRVGRDFLRVSEEGSS